MRPSQEDRDHSEDERQGSGDDRRQKDEAKLVDGGPACLAVGPRSQQHEGHGERQGWPNDNRAESAGYPAATVIDAR